MNKYTSFKLSKKLWENDCKFESNFITYKCDDFNGYYDVDFFNELDLEVDFKNYFYSYDILWDICVKYSKEFFGDECDYNSSLKRITRLLRENKIEELEAYIWDVCEFNPKNKEV